MIKQKYVQKRFANYRKVTLHFSLLLLLKSTHTTMDKINTGLSTLRTIDQWIQQPLKVTLKHMANNYAVHGFSN